MTAPTERQGITVVVAAWHSVDALAECLTALAREPGSADLEVLVCRGEALMPVGSRPSWFGRAQDVVLPTGTSVPGLRAEGVRRAKGTHVALLEDHCPVRPGWLHALRGASRAAPTAVVGGPVAQEEGARSATSWAVYLQDYAGFAPPLPTGLSAVPSGCNASLPRALLDDLESVWQDGVYEASLWAAIHRAGVPMLLVEGLEVEHRGRYRLGWALRQAWHHGRVFGAWRDARSKLVVRLSRVAIAPALLMMIPFRIMLRLPGRRLRLLSCLAAGPALMLLIVAWVAGESWGALAGEGRSLAEWA